MSQNHHWIATRVSGIAVLVLILLAGCEEDPPIGPSGLPYCWNNDCPTDPGAETCGVCKDQGHDVECPPGYVCSCDAVCVKGPRSYDGGLCLDAPGPATPDAQIYEWPACDMTHLPGT